MPTMPWDAISDYLVWIGAAAVFVVLVAVIAIYSVNKPKPYDGTKHYDAIQNQQDGWIPTGRVDFFDPQSIDNFILQVEETRSVGGVGSVERREIRWRTATLEEADSVLVGYHAQRNLAMAPNYVVTASNTIPPLRTEHHQETQLKQNGASDAQPEGYAKLGGDAAYLLPKATLL